MHVRAVDVTLVVSSGVMGGGGRITMPEFKSFSAFLLA